jgi:hypothetical protein
MIPLMVRLEGIRQKLLGLKVPTSVIDKHISSLKKIQDLRAQQKAERQRKLEKREHREASRKVYEEYLIRRSNGGSPENNDW